jgi:hypothetical protein
MASKAHVIEKYWVRFSARSEYDISLFGESGHIGTIQFVGDDAEVPQPELWPGLQGAKVYFRRSDLPALIDILRNESPVKITVNDQPPGSVFITTGLEPTGEGEA